MKSLARKLTPVLEPVAISCCWYTPNERKDADNVAFAIKFVLDGLVEAGILKGDGRKHVRSLMYTFSVGRINPRTEVYILPI